MMEISPVIVTVILGLTYFDISNKILYFNFIRKKYIYIYFLVKQCFSFFIYLFIYLFHILDYK